MTLSLFVRTVPVCLALEAANSIPVARYRIKTGTAIQEILTNAQMSVAGDQGQRAIEVFCLAIDIDVISFQQNLDNR
jgi:hypothetical protein